MGSETLVTVSYVKTTEFVRKGSVSVMLVSLARTVGQSMLAIKKTAIKANAKKEFAFAIRASWELIVLLRIFAMA